MLPHAEKIIERAKSGERIPANERRHAVAYIMGTDATQSNIELGKLFGVSEGQIRQDKKNIREDRAKLIREEDVALVIADIMINFERQVNDIEKSKGKSALGSKTYLEHCKAIFQLDMQRIIALQNLGYYPKNLGSMTVEKFEFKATVGKDGGVITRPVELHFNEKGQIVDAEFEEIKKLPAPDPSVSPTETEQTPTTATQ